MSGGIMTTVVGPGSRSNFADEYDERTAHRLHGWVIAATATLVIWSGLGFAAWAVFSVFG